MAVAATHPTRNNRWGIDLCVLLCAVQCPRGPGLCVCGGGGVSQSGVIGGMSVLPHVCKTRVFVSALCFVGTQLQRVDHCMQEECGVACTALTLLQEC